MSINSQWNTERSCEAKIG